VGKIKNFVSRFWKLAWGHKKISIVILVILLIVGYIIFPKSSKQILTQKVSKGDVVKMVSVTGKIDADQSVNLSFQTGGKLIYLGAKEGDLVKKWQAIASLDQNELQASFRQAQQDFIAAKAASDKYYDGHKSSGESYDEKIERTALDATQNKAYDEMMKVQQDLNNSTLYSPIDGILTRADAETSGVNVTTATIFTVTDPSSLNFSMDVDEADIGNIKNGQNINLSLDAFPNDILKLKVSQIDFVSHLTTSGGTAFTVKAVLRFNDSYRVGMSGNADIITGTKNDVLNIPLSSIMEDSTVYVKTAKGYEKRKIKLGLQSDTLAEVKSGLSEGEIVAVDPTSVPTSSIVKVKK